MFLTESIKPNFDTPEDLLEWMKKNLKYGTTSHGAYTSTKEILEKKKATCWGAADFEMEYLNKMGYDTKIIFVYLGDPPRKTHTFTIFKKNDKWYWFEWAWGSNEGIHGPFNSNEELRDFVINKWGKFDMHYTHDSKIGREGISDQKFLKNAGYGKL
jgi:hypothetical protein